eukprot:TRINITY_DN15869_c0_g1_i3.p1 TRINITY_DN15869_c0_g1~~TRINITY_DN15869_c0_g1_i3.p1  ORF type:complete len:405 (-),score=63.28 TRINITY_DN15869_c0_g1_i3:139-1353(-)
MISPTTLQALSRYAVYKQTPITIKQFLDFSRDRDFETAQVSCRFLTSELPTRLAHMTKEIDSLPPSLLEQSDIQRVRGWYLQSFQELLEYAQKGVVPTTQVEVDHFTRLIQNIYNRHSPVVMTMARGLLAYKYKHGDQVFDPRIQYFLDRFYMSRIGIRMLLAQHCELFPLQGTKNSKEPAGVIVENCDIREVALDAASNATFLCYQNFMLAPKVQVITASMNDTGIFNPDAPLMVTCAPSHLYHILFELIKNSLRATVECHGSSNSLPKVRVVLAKGEEDVTIKISDEGGGIPRSGVPHLWTYMYTTAKLPSMEDCMEADMNNAPLAGFGYGLPLSRLYARYFGGDLNLISMEGFGTDAYAYLKAVAADAGEVLPSYSATQNMFSEACSSDRSDWVRRNRSKE